MEVLFYIFVLGVCLYFIWNIIKVNIIHPEKGDELRKAYNNKPNINLTNDGKIMCPICKGSDIQLMKRGWKVTTGFLGSGKNIRVCKNCLYKF